jgi:hypothetical protein
LIGNKMAADLNWINQNFRDNSSFSAINNDESSIVIMKSDSNTNIELYTIMNMDSDIIDDSFIEIAV